MKVFLPYRGEFGHKIMWHVPWIHAQTGPKVVCCEPGEECLFPSAERHHIVNRKIDHDRREWLKYDREYLEEIERKVVNLGEIVWPLPKHPQSSDGLKPFVPKPSVPQNIQAEIVVCPRKRDYGSKKNWPHWETLVRRLSGRYSVFAAGAPDSSFDVSCPKAWDYERYLDATIEAMLQARVVIATDSGLAHLAMLCGRPLALVSHAEGCTAPGYGKVKVSRFERLNHCAAKIKLIENAWERPDQVIRWASCLAEDVSDNYFYWVSRYEELGATRTVCNSNRPNIVERTAWIEREFTKRLPDRSRHLLDFGCGIGRLSPFLRTRCERYFGTDIVPAALEIASTQDGAFALLKNGTIPFGNTTFDTVVAVTVLQHVVDEELFASLLRQFSDRMETGGTLLLYENIARRKDADYIRFRRARGYCESLQYAGFEVKTVAAQGRNFKIAKIDEVDALAEDPLHEVHAFFEAVKR